MVSEIGANLIALLALCVGIQWVAGVPAALLGSQYWYDLTGSSTFAIVCLVAVGKRAGGLPLTTPAALCAVAVLVWAARLGSFLFLRIIRDGGVDPRLSKYSSRPLAFLLGPWTMQGLWVAATQLPVLALLAGWDVSPTTQADAWDVTQRTLLGAPAAAAAGLRALSTSPMTLATVPWFAACGLGLWLLALLVQGAADEAKKLFKSDDANSGRFITSGVWAVSQHPNYAAELTMWHALGAVAATLAWATPSHALHGSPWAFATLAGPLLEAALILFVSGVPLLDRPAARKWGHEHEWLAYVANTPVVFPCCGSFPRRATAYLHAKPE